MLSVVCRQAIIKPMKVPYYLLIALLLSLFLPMGSPLHAQSVFDISGSGGKFDVSGSWIVISGTDTVPDATSDVTIMGTDGVTADASITVNDYTSDSLANLVYGTASAGTDIDRTIIFRGTASADRLLAIGGDVTKYDSGLLVFRNNVSTNTSLLNVTVAGNVTVHDGELAFGSNNHGLNSIAVSGTTTLHGGELSLCLNTDANLGALVVNGGALNLNYAELSGGNKNRTINVRNLNGTGGTITEDSTGTAAVYTLAITGDDAADYSGTITNGTGTGTVALLKSGSGQQVLSGENTYAGGTTVTSGSLLVSNTSGSGVGTGAVLVQDGGTFGGSGRVRLGEANSITVEAGGWIAAGGEGSPLVLDGGDSTESILIMEENAGFTFDLSGEAPLVEFWNYEDNTDFVLNDNVIDFINAEEGVYTLFAFYSDDGSTLAESNVASGLVLGSGLEGYDVDLVYGENTITLTLAAVPEPGAFAMLLGAGTMGATLVWRRRRKQTAVTKTAFLRKVLPVMVLILGIPLTGKADPTIGNASFENGLEGWNPKGQTVEVHSGDAADGEKTAYLNFTGKNSLVKMLTKIDGLEEGKTYKLSFQSRGATAEDLRVVLRNLETNKYITSRKAVTGPAWEETTMEFKAPAAQVGLEIRIASPGVCEFDHFQISPAN